MPVTATFAIRRASCGLLVGVVTLAFVVVGAIDDAYA
jgi:hypothetical protein